MRTGSMPTAWTGSRKHGFFFSREINMVHNENDQKEDFAMENYGRDAINRIMEQHDMMKREIARIQEESKEERKEAKNAEKFRMIDQLLKEIEKS